jgi:hypothetical protein
VGRTGVIFTSSSLVVGDLSITRSENDISSLGCRVPAFESLRYLTTPVATRVHPESKSKNRLYSLVTDCYLIIVLMPHEWGSSPIGPVLPLPAPSSRTTPQSPRTRQDRLSQRDHVSVVQRHSGCAQTVDRP